MDKYLQKDFWITQSQTILDQLIAWLSSPQFYAQVGAIIAAILIARIDLSSLMLYYIRYCSTGCGIGFWCRLAYQNSD